MANDFSGALIRAELIERDPTTREPLDYQKIAADLEGNIRARFETDAIDVHIIGFAKSTGDIADGARDVVTFFGITLVITAILLWFYTRSVILSLLPPTVSMVAVVGLLGSLDMLGYGLDPMSILVPFLVFAIGVSHGVQMISGWMGEVMYGGDTDAQGAACGSGAGDSSWRGQYGGGATHFPAAADAGGIGGYYHLGELRHHSAD